MNLDLRNLIISQKFKKVLVKSPIPYLENPLLQLNIHQETIFTDYAMAIFVVYAIAIIVEYAMAIFVVYAIAIIVEYAMAISEEYAMAIFEVNAMAIFEENAMAKSGNNYDNHVLTKC